MYQIGREVQRPQVKLYAAFMSDEIDTNPELAEVLFEVKAVGNAVKVSALDPLTNIEVCVVGSAYASPYSLKMNALRKLRAVLRKKAQEQP